MITIDNILYFHVHETFFFIHNDIFLGGLLSTQHNMNKHWGKADMAAAVAAAAGRNNNGTGNMGNQCPPGVPPNRAGMPPTKMVDQQLWPGNPR